MCLISILPSGTKKYSEKVSKFIESGMITQSDGSGFMFRKKGENKIHISKGYFDYNELMTSLDKFKLNDEDELVIHHRTGTGGKICKENTHPFLIVDNETLCSYIELTSDLPALVHNGIFFGIYEYENLNFDFCDSYAFARYIMSDPNVYGLFINNKNLFDKLFHNIVGNDRIVILDPKLGILKTGSFIEDNGYFHSNSCYINNKQRDSGGYSFYYNGEEDYEMFPKKNSPILIDTFSENTKKYNLIDDNKNIQDAIILDEVFDDKENAFALNFSDINFSDNNCHHFWLIKSKVYDDLTRSETVTNKIKDKLFEINIFNDKSETQKITRADRYDTFGYFFSFEDICKEYLLLPKPSYRILYRDYFYLRDNFKLDKYEKKDLKKLLANNKGKSIFETISWDKITSTNNKFLKGSLDLYYQFLTTPFKQEEREMSFSD